MNDQNARAVGEGRPQVICLGAITQDTLFQVSFIPPAPAKILPTACVRSAAGMATSAATAAARLGGRVALWGRLGDDGVGDAILAELALEGIDLGDVRRVPGVGSPIATILIDPQGERLVIPWYDPRLGADPGWLPLHKVKGAGAVLADVRWPDGAAALLSAARAAGTPALLDADVGPPEVLARLVPLADQALFSEPALLAYAGLDDPHEALRRVAAGHPGLVGVTRGADGFDWMDEGEIRHVDAPEVVAVDTLAAGDVFHGAYALVVAQGGGVEEAARLGCLAASMKCTRFGGRRCAPSHEEVAAELNRREWPPLRALAP